MSTNTTLAKQLEALAARVGALEEDLGSLAVVRQLRQDRAEMLEARRVGAIAERRDLAELRELAESDVATLRRALAAMHRACDWLAGLDDDDLDAFLPHVPSEKIREDVAIRRIALAPVVEIRVSPGHSRSARLVPITTRQLAEVTRLDLRRLVVDLASSSALRVDLGPDGQRFTREQWDLITAIDAPLAAWVASGGATTVRELDREELELHWINYWRARHVHRTAWPADGAVAPRPRATTTTTREAP